MGFNQDEFLARARGLRQDDDASIFQSNTNPTQETRVITFDLTTARTESNPYVLGFAFRSFLVLSGTDSAATVNIKLATQDSFQDRIPVNTIVSTFQLPYAVAKAYIDWTAQSGKTLTMIFFKSGVMSLNRVSTALTAINGTTLGAPTSVTLAAATAAIILVGSASRNTAIAQNETGNDIWVGDSTVTNTGSTRGIRYGNGERIIWQNTAALYGYSVGGGTVVTVEES